MKTEVVDVRDDIRRGAEPFSKIMGAAANVNVGDSLLLLVPFEPMPLFKVMERQGFTHSGKQTRAGHWEICFTRVGETPADVTLPTFKTPPNFASSNRPVEIVELDTRGMEPPQPLVTILETIPALPVNAELQARTDRRPMHLYPELEARGFNGETEEQSDGSFITHIRRR
ncbi:MAG TPA: DUF2249 domain-containing protein [Verrucomicrobiae bacterium]|nr:DUF2249 domain-containing protein [Verrucomicrobiae bacterium]